MFKNLIYYAQNSGNYFVIFFIFLALYGIIKTLFSVPEFIFNRFSARKLFSILGSIAILFIIGFLFFVLMDRALGKINVAGISEKVARNNDFLMELDRRLFHAYVPFWFENADNPLKALFSNFSVFFVKAYISLPVIIAISLIASLIKSSDLFLKIISIYFITIFVSMFFWFFLPATSPLDAYVDRVPQPPPNIRIEKYLATYRPSLSVIEFNDSIRTIREGLGEKLWVTTIPSMHIVWSVVILYAAIMLSRYLVYIITPYFILNLISTMLTLQHYAVDVVLGLIVAILAIKLVNNLPPLKIPMLNLLSNSIRQDIYELRRLFKPE